MIPPPDVQLTPEQMARWRLTKLAAALVRDGVSANLVMIDAKEGTELGRKARGELC